jgi:hypothetical protein
MNRREFLQYGLAASSALFAFERPRVCRGTSSPRRFTLSAPLTHSDWMIKPHIKWGPDGVRHMLDACKACGWSHVHWRAFDGGRADYPSKIARPFNDWDEDNFFEPKTDEGRQTAAKYTAGMTPQRKQEILDRLKLVDYSKFDALAEAVRYGHSIGLKITAWVSINEDDHGWGIQSDFSKQHPQFRWKRRDGRFYKSQMSFAFPEVRAYKLAILKELIDNYAIDGLFLDWIRTGDVRDNPQTDPDGTANSGYEEPLVAEFKKRHGIDPHEVSNNDERWVRVRSGPQTMFMRDARKLVTSVGRSIPMSVMVGHPWHYRGHQDPINGNLQGLLLDVKTWAREGLMDAACPAGYYRSGGNAELAYQALRDETEKSVPIWMYAWVPNNVSEVESTFASADKVGAEHILYWEADYIDDRASAANIKAALKQRALPQ